MMRLLLSATLASALGPLYNGKAPSLHAKFKGALGEGDKVTGDLYVWPAPYGKGVHIQGQVLNVTPVGKHGFHVHMLPCAQKAGGHLNPWKATHGSPDNVKHKRHAGDLGNMKQEHLKAPMNILIDDPYLTIDLMKGRSFVLHAGEDDLGMGKGKDKVGSLNTGNAGMKLACADIRHYAGTWTTSKKVGGYGFSPKSHLAAREDVTYI